MLEKMVQDLLERAIFIGGLMAIGGLVFFLLIVPGLILAIVRKKKSRTLIATPQTSSPASWRIFKPGTETVGTDDLQAFRLEHTGSRHSAMLTWISAGLFSLACALPIGPGKEVKDLIGLFALAIGFLVFPLWIPNPLYFAGFAFALKRRYRVSLVLGAIATGWAAVVVCACGGNRELGDVGSWFWVASMLVLVIASIVGLPRQSGVQRGVGYAYEYARAVFDADRIKDLARTQVTDAGLEHLKGLTQLQALFLDSTQITDAGLVYLKGLTKLEFLRLQFTQITGAGLVHLKGMTSLQTLYLNDTQITDAGLVHLKGLTGLQTLELSNTKVTDAGVADLQKALPNCKISK